MLRLDDYYVWDWWVADDGKRYHLFFLQAPRSVGDPANRHVNAEIGHATSRDLVDWDDLGPTFQPSEIGRRAFDDMAIWTGSVLNDWATVVDVLHRDLACGPPSVRSASGRRRFERPSSLAPSRQRAGGLPGLPLVQDLGDQARTDERTRHRSSSETRMVSG